MPTLRPTHSLAASLLVLALACAHGARPTDGVPAPTKRLITVEELQRSFSQHARCTVVFDIDDTSLFTAGAFHFAQGFFEARDSGQERKDPAFWTMINDSLDRRFSRPKEIARRLIAWHRSRGDTIVFITARFPSTPPSDRTSRLLMRLFELPAPPRVLFTAQAPKTDAIRSVKPALSYGDSDGDIRDTKAADPAIRAIRIQRSVYSYNLQPPEPGKFGEEILAGSAD